MASQVYVGKDVDVTIQIPVEEEDVSGQFTSSMSKNGRS
jgi:hypothetical protein